MMATFLFDEIIFGPIKSRRLGCSLGINLLPLDSKICNFDCIYCECGWSEKEGLKNSKFIDKVAVLENLEKTLKKLYSNQTPLDCITFAGNGEPTLHPHFSYIITEVQKLRDRFFPDCSIAVLSNATTLNKKKVFEILKNVDKNILKLDAGTAETFEIINKPLGKINLDSITEKLKLFNGKLIIQSLFLKGLVGGRNIDNSESDEIEKWLERLKDIAPQEVMIYTIDRDTPLETLEKIPNHKLIEIANQVREIGITATVN